MALSLMPSRAQHVCLTVCDCEIHIIETILTAISGAFSIDGRFGIITVSDSLDSETVPLLVENTEAFLQ